MAEKNDQFIFKAKDILKLLISSGAEAYIVGESLRDIVLNRDLNIIEIFTSLPKENTLLLFCDYKISDLNESAIILEYLDYRFKISFPKIYNFKNKIKTNISKRHYSSSLMDFLEQKDYTINTLSMGVNNVIYDCFNGREDLSKKRIKMISDNPGLVYSISPVKILDTIALVSELGYKLDSSLYAAIKRKAHLLKNVSLENISIVMRKIITGVYFRKALKILIKTRVYKRIPIYKFELKRLSKNFVNEDIDTFLGICLVKDKKYNEIIGETSSSPYLFKRLFNLAITNQKGNYDTLTLYANGLDICIKANEINYILGRTGKKTKLITKMYNALPIKKTCDLAFKGEDIINFFKERSINIESLEHDYLNNLVDNIIYEILDNKLSNDYESIKNYVVENTADICVNTKEVVEETFEEENNEVIKVEEIKEKPEEHLLNFSELQKRQEDLVRRVSELEISNLRTELERDIDRKIKQSGLLDGLTGNYRNNTYETLKKVYYDVLINTEKYERLRNLNE